MADTDAKAGKLVTENQVAGMIAKTLSEIDINVDADIPNSSSEDVEKATEEILKYISGRLAPTSITTDDIDAMFDGTYSPVGYKYADEEATKYLVEKIKVI